MGKIETFKCCRGNFPVFDLTKLGLNFKRKFRELYIATVMCHQVTTKSKTKIMFGLNLRNNILSF